MLGPFPALLIDGIFKRRPPSRTCTCAPLGGGWWGVHAEDREGINAATQPESAHLGILLCVISFLFVPNQVPSLIVTQATAPITQLDVPIFTIRKARATYIIQCYSCSALVQHFK